jgi:hypothetical protein
VGGEGGVWGGGVWGGVVVPNAIVDEIKVLSWKRCLARMKVRPSLFYKWSWDPGTACNANLLLLLPYCCCVLVVLFFSTSSRCV